MAPLPRATASSADRFGTASLKWRTKSFGSSPAIAKVAFSSGTRDVPGPPASGSSGAPASAHAASGSEARLPSP